MSSLIPERQLVVSPSLAATIGLEEAVLLQLLHEAAALLPAEQRSGFRWLTIPAETLQTLAPFWPTADLQRVCKSLADKGVILTDSPPLTEGAALRFAFNEQQSDSTAARPAGGGANLLAAHWQPDEELLRLLQTHHGIDRDFALAQREEFILYWRERGDTAHSWSSKFRQHVLREWQRQRRNDDKRQPGADWYPSEDALEILERSGVSRAFMEDAVPEFVLYWRERGAASSTWNSKFIAHIRRQWARYTHAVQHDTEPRPIPENWQPDRDVFDILAMANIDADFARQLVPEFVLYWRDSGELQRSWNSKFLQHVKYQWAQRHHLEQHHAGQPRHRQTGFKDPRGFIERHTDRSWREGI